MSESLSFINRVLYAFVMTVLVTMALGVFAIIFRLNIVPWLLSGAIPVPVAIVGYLIAPYLARRIRRG